MDPESVTRKVEQILDKNKDKRVVILGTTCTGKTTLHKLLPDAVDMDEALFPLLTPEESDYVNQTPWTEEIGAFMRQLVLDKVRVEPGKPLIGTIVAACDLIIILQISDKLLGERCIRRRVSMGDAKNMRKQIMDSAHGSGIPIKVVDIG